MIVAVASIVILGLVAGGYHVCTTDRYDWWMWNHGLAGALSPRSFDACVRRERFNSNRWQVALDRRQLQRDQAISAVRDERRSSGLPALSKRELDRQVGKLLQVPRRPDMKAKLTAVRMEAERADRRSS